MQETVHVNLGERSYDILVGSGLGIGRTLSAARGRAALIVTDENVDALYGARFEAACREAGIRAARFAVPAGEPSKEARWLARVWEAAVAAGLDRSSFVVALGGGVVGDLAGFAAATYLRGVRLIQAPTSLLAMADSSVGGKTGINLPQGKNLAGAFHQPEEVIADIDCLRSLPAREYRSGLAEVVKHAAIRDAALFAELERSAADVLAARSDLMRGIVARNCAIKAAVVAADEREAGLRAILNFGHTAGHAIEQADGYGRWLHGEAVALGMAYASRLSIAAAGLPERDHARILRLLDAFGLPVRRPADAPPLAWETVREAMRVDKKAVGRAPRFVLLSRIGEATAGHELPDASLSEAWKEIVPHVSGQ